MTTLDIATVTRLMQGSRATLKSLLTEVDKKARPARSNAVQRKAALTKAVQDFDVEVLVRLQDQMQQYVDAMARIFPDEPRQLTHTEAVAVATEVVSLKEIKEFLDARYETLRGLTFMSIEEEALALGKDTPATGEIAVPEVGKTLRKEGGGYSAPSLDHDKLRAALGDNADEVFAEKVIPAHTEVVLDEAKLMDLIARRPEVMELVAQCLTPGKERAARFVVRDLKEED